MAHFCDNLKEGGLIESVYEGGGYGLITRKEYVWLEVDEIEDAINYASDDLGNYAFHVLASYGATSLVILVVIIWSYIKHDRARKILLSLEEKVNEK